MVLTMIFGFLLTPGRRITEKLLGDRLRGGRIRCPACDWQPQPHDRWCCAPGCGEVWNTFETRGTCPGCLKHWTHTACHRCDTWSPHEAWYEETE